MICPVIGVSYTSSTTIEKYLVLISASKVSVDGLIVIG